MKEEGCVVACVLARCEDDFKLLSRLEFPELWRSFVN